MAERLTPWNAPKPSERIKQAYNPQLSLNTTLSQLNSQLGISLTPPPKKKPQPLKWWQWKKKWNRKYEDKTLLETPAAYLWYLMLIAPQIPGVVKGNPLSCVSVGFIIGVMLATFFHRQSMASKDSWHKMELELKEQEVILDLKLRGVNIPPPPPARKSPSGIKPPFNSGISLY